MWLIWVQVFVYIKIYICLYCIFIAIQCSVFFEAHATFLNRRTAVSQILLLFSKQHESVSFHPFVVFFKVFRCYSSAVISVQYAKYIWFATYCRWHMVVILSNDAYIFSNVPFFISKCKFNKSILVKQRFVQPMAHREHLLNLL